MKDKETKELINNVNIPLVNKMLGQTDLKDFEMNKATLCNIADWALNGSSDTEIRKKLSLNKNQWAILVTVCPTLLLVMQHSRAMADMVVAGSLFQTAIGGQKIKKQQPMRVRDYDDKGQVCGEHYEIIEYEEELPPNPVLLKFLAEHKLSEQFGETKVDQSAHFQSIIDNMTPEEKALIEMASKSGEINGSN